VIQAAPVQLVAPVPFAHCSRVVPTVARTRRANPGGANRTSNAEASTNNPIHLLGRVIRTPMRDHIDRTCGCDEAKPYSPRAAVALSRARR
jgi:hypothetical protein